MARSRYVVGIDLGTTNSTLAYVDTNEGEAAPIKQLPVPQVVAPGEVAGRTWLCHPGVDRRAPILPWKAPESTRHVSPLEACKLYLQHLAEAWNHTMAADNPAARLDLQEVVLTVPASFDAAARELTVEAAKL